MVVELPTLYPLPQLRSLPTSLPMDGAVRMELEEGVPIFKASAKIQARIETLLAKQQQISLTEKEEEELDRYEEIDDYLSFVNRLLRNATSHTRTSSGIRSPQLVEG